jgi:hypothetical protein
MSSQGKRGLIIRSIYVWVCSRVVQVNGLMFSGYDVVCVSLMTARDAPT